ncbi:arsenate reductase (glutaredoxin) [Sulfitobacter aestuariivivens]|uniref:Arsenate reductase n=1 Tax=Sulfitobacter aestuariivivens TaxID=2766981 RepID=A0A927D6T4_9RHOB|nr:arsenate reductase (glutaredoxin) [Sulfitobacter aestuariivivens]MBD3664272.1 arsenate reductase (glutaredoxin) [Sulfitobacter aestuariivivens]
MITIWHNPRCSKSRQALALIEAAGIDVTVRKYLEDAPGVAELETAQQALGLTSAIDMMRTGEKVFRELGLSKDTPDTDLRSAMATHPILIERPIVFNAGNAVVGRPPEAVKALL